MATPAFASPSPSTLSTSSRRPRALKTVRDRSWLQAPAIRQVAESSLAAWRAGALPEVNFLPVSPPASSPHSQSSSLSSSPQYSTSSVLSDTSPATATPAYDSDDLDSLCRRIEAVLDNVGINATLRDDFSNSLSNTPSRTNSYRDSSSSDSSADEDLVLPSTRETSFRTPSPVRSEANSDDLDELALLTVRRRRLAESKFFSHSSSSDSEDESDYFQGRFPSKTRSRRVFRDISENRSQVLVDRVDDDSEKDDDDREDLVDGLCRGIENNLRFPFDTQPRYKSLELDKHDDLLPALKGAASWLGLSTLPFQHLRERAAERLMLYFDREVLSGQLVRDRSPKEKVTVAWSGRLTKTAGITHLKRIPGETRIAAIVLSEKVVDEPLRLYNTLAHELCHAAAWIIDGSFKPPHGKHFKRWAKTFRDWDHSLIITTCHEYEIRYKFKYSCRDCGQIYGRHSRSIDTSVKVCGKCRGGLQLMKNV